MTGISQYFGNALAKYLTTTVSDYKPFSIHRYDTLVSIMRPGDVLLVEGDHRISTAIKYLTQSTWSHAAFFIGQNNHSRGCNPLNRTQPDEPLLIEADLKNGVITVPLKKYTQYNTRICRPVELTDDDSIEICNYMIDSLGNQYDLKNVIDLARYLLPTPPVPVRWRRRMLSLGSSDPTRAICSTLIAQAFQLIQYPILPEKLSCSTDGNSHKDILHIRHHSLFTPRDFDVSPYFKIIKPELDSGFNYKKLHWRTNQTQPLTVE